MFRHVVMFRFGSWVTAEQTAAVLDGLAALPAAVPGVRSFSFSRDVGLSESNFDVVVVADFDDRDGYLTYAAHEAHRRLVADVILPAVADRSAVQYEMGDPAVDTLFDAH